MSTIGIRELRQNASRYLRLVEAGEIVEICDRGRPIARLVPITGSSVVERLQATGQLSTPLADLLDVAPVPPSLGIPVPSEVLQAARDQER